MPIFYVLVRRTFRFNFSMLGAEDMSVNNGNNDRKTFKDVLDRNRGIGPGFDVLRIVLSVAIFYGHTLYLSGILDSQFYQDAARQSAEGLVQGGWEGIKRPLHVALVPMFFALSGFLVMGSAVRLRATPTFLANRALRIFPALAVELALSALLLGAAFTQLPLRDYFTHPAFFSYAGNLIGIVQMHLPGVFLDNPEAGIINANLWTLPSEFNCYLVTAVLMITGVLFNRRTMTILFVPITIGLAAANLFSDFAVTNTAFPEHVITYYFFAGAMLFHWRDRITYSIPLFLAAGVATYGLLMSHHAVYLAAIPLTYATVHFGMFPLPKFRLLASGDYSYGIYLYGFPIAQAVVAAVPAIRGHGTLLLLVAGLLTALFAAFSWHVIEKPSLAQKRRLPPRWFPTPVRGAPKPAMPAMDAAALTPSGQTGGPLSI